MRFKGCFYAAACGWSMLFLLSCCGSITLVYSLSTLGEGTILHCLWRTFGFQSMMYMDGAWDCIVTVSAEKRTASALQTAISPMCSRCFCLLPFILSCPPPLPLSQSSLILFSAFHFLHKGKMRKNKTNIWKLKHDREGRGWWGRGGVTEEGEAISENKRAFKSKGWKLVRLLFLKNDPCVVLLLRARYILFYLPGETQRGVSTHTHTHTNKKKNLSDAFFKVAQFIVFNGMPDRCVLNCLSALAWNVSLITYQILNFQMRLHFDNQLFKKKFFYTSNVCTSPNWQSAPTLQAKNAHFPSLTRTAPLSLIEAGAGWHLN